MELKFWYKVKLAVLILGIIVIYLIPLDYVEGRSFCMFYNYFNETCLGCGFSRAFFNMTRLNFKEAIIYNPMIIVLGPTFIGIYVHEFIHAINRCREKTNKKGILESVLQALFDRRKI